MPLDALVFDFDGLVVDTEWAEYVSIAELFGEHGTELDLAMWQGFIGTTDHPHWTDILAEQLGRPVERQALIRTRRERNRAALEALEINEGIVELLDDAHAAGVPVGVASSSPREWVEEHLGRLGLVERFDAIRTGDEVERTKPAPDVYLLALRSLGAEPARSVAVEDSPNGCAAAKAAGMRVVAVPSSLTRGMDFGAADLVVASAAELDLVRLAGLLP